MIIEVWDHKVLDHIGDGDMQVAALAAIRKTCDTFRVIHDGTHGVLANSPITVRDQMRRSTPETGLVKLHEICDVQTHLVSHRDTVLT